MRNYPDDCPSHLFGEEDMDGVEKLSCGCYEEACECPTCEHCGELLNEIPGLNEKICPNECEDDEE